MSQERLNARLRAIKWWGVAIFAATAVVWAAVGAWRPLTGGLLLGELGGAYVVVSLISQGHRDDDMQGIALFTSGMVGLFTRILALVAVMVIAEHWRHCFNPYTALIGYLLGFVLVFVGLYGLARNRHTDS